MSDWLNKDNDIFYFGVAVVMKALWNPDNDAWRENLKHTIVSVCLAILAIRTVDDWNIDAKYRLPLVIVCVCFSHLILNGLMAFVKNLFADGAIFERFNPFREKK